VAERRGERGVDDDEAVLGVGDASKGRHPFPQ
jgi:hypothetical protein